MHDVLSPSIRSNASYRYAGIGYGNRKDFTLENVVDKGDFSHDYSRMKTMKSSLDKKKEMATKLSYTFGSSHNEKYVVPSCKAHYLGRGT